MANRKTPLLGSGEILDLQAHVKAKAQRELLARLVAERNNALNMLETMGTTMVAISEVLAECRTALAQFEALTGAECGDLVKRITELLGDGE